VTPWHAGQFDENAVQD
jgi:hypothetical protein